MAGGIVVAKTKFQSHLTSLPSRLPFGMQIQAQLWAQRDFTNRSIIFFLAYQAISSVAFNL